VISERDMMHGHDYNRQDVSGWLMSEKLNGCRAYWDGSIMWSRGGKVIAIPDAWRTALPEFELDGEIYAGVGNFELARKAVQYGKFTTECQFMAFDMPAKNVDYAERYEALTRILPLNGPVCYVPHRTISGISQAVTALQDIQAAGGEGVMLRDPLNVYAAGRTAQILKLKYWEA
jgi:DNA ligase-1